MAPNFWKVPTMTNDLHEALERFNSLPDDESYRRGSPESFSA
jgi:hypothetical protein